MQPVVLWLGGIQVKPFVRHFDGQPILIDMNFKGNIFIRIHLIAVFYGVVQHLPQGQLQIELVKGRTIFRNKIQSLRQIMVNLRKGRRKIPAENMKL
jgi:hypothetical protein